MKSIISIVVLLAIVLLPVTAIADDHPFSRPAWRGLAGSTFQHWHFPASNPDGPEPDDVDNPYGNPVMDDATTADWLNSYQGRSGVYRVIEAEGDNLEFTVPNEENALFDKYVQTQLTWFNPGKGADDDMSRTEELVDGDGAPAGLVRTVNRALANGWRHKTSVWKFNDYCPDEVVYTFTPPTGGTYYVDQVVIDTYCSEPTIPTLTEWGLIILTLVVLGTMTYVIIRKRRLGQLPV